MKSRYFSIPGLLVDVTEIVGVRYDVAHPYLLFRNGVEYDVQKSDAKCIVEYIEEYEHQFDVSRSLAGAPLPSFMTGSGDTEA